MAPDEREQVRKILNRLQERAVEATNADQKAMHAKHASEGVLRSGATVKRAVAIIEARALDFVQEATDQVGVVAKDMEAYALIETSLRALFRSVSEQVDKAVELATVRSSAMQSVKSSAANLFSKAQTTAFSDLGLQRFSFTKPSPKSIPNFSKQLGFSDEAVGREKLTPSNPGGKPLAAHWDAMWAAICVQLWNGDLQPAKQADIKAAMLDWFAREGIDVGDTAATERARALWQAIEADKG